MLHLCLHERKQRYFCLICRSIRNLRLFTQAFGTIYSNYSTDVVRRVVGVDSAPYLTHLP